MKPVICETNCLWNKFSYLSLITRVLCSLKDPRVSFWLLKSEKWYSKGIQINRFYRAWALLIFSFLGRGVQCIWCVQHDLGSCDRQVLHRHALSLCLVCAQVGAESVSKQADATCQRGTLLGMGYVFRNIGILHLWSFELNLCKCKAWKCETL